MSLPTLVFTYALDDIPSAIAPTNTLNEMRKQHQEIVNKHHAENYEYLLWYKRLSAVSKEIGINVKQIKAKTTSKPDKENAERMLQENMLKREEIILKLNTLYVNEMLKPDTPKPISGRRKSSSHSKHMITTAAPVVGSKRTADWNAPRNNRTI